MSNYNKDIDAFFSMYERHFNEGMTDPTGVVAESVQYSFADCFVESSPLGVVCGKNDKSFVEKVKQGFEFYRSIGSQSMNITTKEVTMLDEVHALVKVYWRYSYMKDTKPGTIDFNVFYFLTLVNDPKIFAYVTGDEQKALREKGLIPQQESTAQ